jgi:XTP/dITP diphosphohydrolase
MTRKIEGRLVVATRNEGKVAEIRELLAAYDIEVVPPSEFDLPSPDETGLTYAENAGIKAHAAAQATGLPSLADDSGLCVDVLDGLPGLDTAEWGGPDRSQPAALARLEREMARRGAAGGGPAHFVSALVVAWPDGHEELFEGRIRGAIRFPPAPGTMMMFDPVFRPEGHDVAFSQMSERQKNGADGAEPLSHRARAFRLFAEACLTEREPVAGFRT